MHTTRLTILRGADESPVLLPQRQAGHLAVVPEGAPTPDGAIELPAGMKLPAR